MNSDHATTLVIRTCGSTVRLAVILAVGSPHTTLTPDLGDARRWNPRPLENHHRDLTDGLEPA